MGYSLAFYWHIINQWYTGWPPCSLTSRLLVWDRGSTILSMEGKQNEWPLILLDVIPFKCTRRTTLLSSFIATLVCIKKCTGLCKSSVVHLYMDKIRWWQLPFHAFAIAYKCTCTEVCATIPTRKDLEFCIAFIISFIKLARACKRANEFPFLASVFL